MASIWKHPKSRFWTACFTDRNGRRLKRSTKTTDRKCALKLAEQFEEASRKKRTAQQARRVLQDVHRSITGEELASLSVRDHVENWLEEKRNSTAPATRAFYKYASGKLLAFLGEAAERDLCEITRQDIIRFRSAEAKLLAVKSVNHELKCVRMIFKAARRDGLISEDPTEFVEVVKGRSESKRRPFTLDELRAVLSVSDDQWRSMILCGIYTGQRLGDIATIRWSHVDLRNGEIRFTTRKTNRRIIVPIAQPLRKHLESMPKAENPETPLHPQACAIVEKQGRSGSLSNQFADLLARAGLREKKSHRKTGDGRSAPRNQSGLSFHALRHTAVTLLKEAGIPSAVVMELVGHDSEEMSQHYTHVGRATPDKAAAALPDLVG
jgi:integrase